MSEMAKALPQKRYVAVIEKLDCERCLIVDGHYVPHCDCTRHGQPMWYTGKIRLTND